LPVFRRAQQADDQVQPLDLASGVPVVELGPRPPGLQTMVLFGV
jgi:hypothetical protein